MESLDNVLSFLNTVIWEYLLIYVLGPVDIRGRSGLPNPAEI
jgi:hypothetical protein